MTNSLQCTEAFSICQRVSSGLIEGDSPPYWLRKNGRWRGFEAEVACGAGENGTGVGRQKLPATQARTDLRKTLAREGCANEKPLIS